MATFKKVKLSNEKELHSIIEKELDALEEGLELLQYEFATSKGNPDFLCVDSGGKLVIIEVKVGEDENILFQALRYYSEISKIKYVIANMFPDKKIKPELEPRIILISERFSDDLRRLATLVTPEVELYEYAVLQDKNGKMGIYFHQVTIPKIEELPPAPPSFDELENYITDEKLREAYKMAISSIESIANDIEKYPTRSYVGFRFRGRLIGYVYPHRKSFDVGTTVLDENGRAIEDSFIRVEEPETDISDILEKIRRNYEVLSQRR